MSDSRLIAGTGLRGNVERLLRGEINANDLHELFFNLRNESGGSGLASEIANFIAHPLRTQGSVWQDINDAVAILKLHYTVLSNPLITRDIPNSVPSALRANLRRIRKQILTRKLGMNRAQASAILERVLARSVPTSPGRVSKIEVKSPEEKNVVTCIAIHLKGGPIFKSSGLIEDFCRALQNMKLLDTSEKSALKKHAAAITLFALTTMHNRKIDLGDDHAIVSINRDIYGNLATFAKAEVGKIDRPGPQFAHLWIFETNLSVSAYCDPNVAPLERTPFVGDFELTSRLTLGRR